MKTKKGELSIMQSYTAEFLDWLNHDSRAVAKAFGEQLKRTEAQRTGPRPVRRWP